MNMKNVFFVYLPIFILGFSLLPVQNAWSQEDEAFTQERFEALQAEGALILLDVFASWCPTCAKPNWPAAETSSPAPPI